MWKNPNTISLTYIPTNPVNMANKASMYTNNLAKSEFEKYEQNIYSKYKSILDKGCFYIPNHVCLLNDYTLFNNIIEELKNNNIIRWSRHEKYENPTFSPTFTTILNKVAKYFNVQIVESRLNYYKNGNDWKPYHHDSHAFYNDNNNDNYNKIREDFTIGISLGASRELSFVLAQDQNYKFNFPQNNGDVFAFNKDVNKIFMHGVPKSKSKGDRISIIAWCKKIEN